MLWDRLTTKRFREHVLGQVDTVVLPVGGVVAHGQHLPLGTDNLVPQQLAEALERRYPDRLLVMPAIPYGHSWDLADWPGTVSVPTDVLSRYVTAVGQAAAGWGMRHVVILNGHEGNASALGDAMEAIAEHGPTVFLVHWWLDFRQEILTVASGPGHGGEDETSLMLAVAGTAVHMDEAAFNPYTPRYRVKAQGLLQKGWRHALTGDARTATRDKGERLFSLITDGLAELVEDIWADRLFDQGK